LKNSEIIGDINKTGISNGRIRAVSLFVYDEEPFVAFSDEYNSGKGILKRFSNGLWQIVGNAEFSSDRIIETSLYIDNGIPYVAYISNWKITVMKCYQGKWITVGKPNFSSAYVMDINWSVNNGVPYVAYNDSGKATVMKCVNDTWEPVGRQGFSEGKVSMLSFFVYNNIPYIAFSDEANQNKITVMKYE
jgi:hypothetical protein